MTRGFALAIAIESGRAIPSVPADIVEIREIIPRPLH